MASVVVTWTLGVLGAGTAVAATTTVPAPPAPTTTLAPPPTLPGGAPDVAAAAFILVDVDTGQVLAAKSEHTPHLSASTAKTVTALTALRLVDSAAMMTGTLLSGSRPASRIGVLPGQKWSFTDLLWCMMLPSANDAAYVVAENTSGNLVDFAKAMNETAQKLGMRDSTFADPAGLDSDAVLKTANNDGRDYVSAWDLAIAGRAVLANPLLASMVSTANYSFTGGDGKAHSLLNHNKLVRPKSGIYYDGMIGVKTGYTKAANGTFIGAAERNGRRLMAVVMATPNIYATSEALLDWGFSLPSTDIGDAKLPAVVRFEPGQAQPAAVAGIGNLADLPVRATPTTIDPPDATPTTAALDTPDTVEDPAGAEATVPPTEAVQAAAGPVAAAPPSKDDSDSDAPPVVIGAAIAAGLGVLLIGARRRMLDGGGRPRPIRDDD